MLLIEVKSNEVIQRNLTTKKNKQMTLHEQQVYFHIVGAAYPVRGRINVPDDRQPYQAGMYVLSGNNFYTDNFGGLKLSMHTILEPFQESKQ